MIAVSFTTSVPAVKQPIKQTEAPPVLTQKTKQVAKETTALKSGKTIFRSTYGTFQLITPIPVKVVSLARAGGLGALLAMIMEDN